MTIGNGWTTIVLMTTTAISSVPVGSRSAMLENDRYDAHTGIIQRRREYVILQMAPVTEADILFAREVSGYDYTGCVEVVLFDGAHADRLAARGRPLPTKGKRMIIKADDPVEVVG